MHLHPSRLVTAALLLLTSVSLAAACPDDAPGSGASAPQVSSTGNLSPTPHNSLFESGVSDVLLDHEGEGFTALTAFQQVAFENRPAEDAETGVAETVTASEETTGSTSMIALEPEMALDGYEDR